MRPLGKTYLIEIPDIKEEKIEGGIILPAENKNKLVHYRGIIKEVGLGFDKLNDNIVNKGDTIIFDWKEKKGKVKLLLSKDLYYIVEEPLILAKEEN